MGCLPPSGSKKLQKGRMQKGESQPGFKNSSLLAFPPPLLSLFVQGFLKLKYYPEPLYRVLIWRQNVEFLHHRPWVIGGSIYPHHRPCGDLGCNRVISAHA